MCARARVHACHALGTGDEALAKLTSKLSLVVIACVQTFTGLCLIALRHQVHANALRLPSSSSRIILKWGYIFSESAAVVQEVAAVLPLCGCYAVLDAICGVSAGKGSACASPSFIFLTTAAGILRACGKQMVGAVTNILAYWAIGIPISTVLGIQKG